MVALVYRKTRNSFLAIGGPWDGLMIAAGDANRPIDLHHVWGSKHYVYSLLKIHTGAKAYKFWVAKGTSEADIMAQLIDVYHISRRGRK